MNRRQRRHFERFHEVSIYDPRRVLQAYGGDFDRVMANNDAQVALRVAAWERQQGFFVRNWSGAEAQPSPYNIVWRSGRTMH